jgi:hypothetical protein
VAFDTYSKEFKINGFPLKVLWAKPQAEKTQGVIPSQSMPIQLLQTQMNPKEIPIKTNPNKRLYDEAFPPPPSTTQSTIKDDEFIDPFDDDLDLKCLKS